MKAFFSLFLQFFIFSSLFFELKWDCFLLFLLLTFPTLFCPFLLENCKPILNWNTLQAFKKIFLSLSASLYLLATIPKSHFHCWVLFSFLASLFRIYSFLRVMLERFVSLVVLGCLHNCGFMMFEVKQYSTDTNTRIRFPLHTIVPTIKFDWFSLLFPIIACLLFYI